MPEKSLREKEYNIEAEKCKSPHLEKRDAGYSQSERRERFWLSLLSLCEYEEFS
jgi:hypothetical protein